MSFIGGRGTQMFSIFQWVFVQILPNNNYQKKEKMRGGTQILLILGVEVIMNLLILIENSSLCQHYFSQWSFIQWK